MADSDFGRLLDDSEGELPVESGTNLLVRGFNEGVIEQDQLLSFKVW